MKGLAPYMAHFASACRARDYTEGLRIARDAHDRCPDARARTWYWQACMLSLLGNLEESIGVLRQGLDEGAWYNPPLMDGDHDLDPLRSMGGYREVRLECTRRQREAQAVSRPQCMVIGPASTGWEPQTVIVLHRWGDTASAFAELWTPLVDKGWTLVVPQSSQVCDSSSFCWDDAEKANAEVLQHVDDCFRKRGLAPDGTVIAGASQGARLAMEIAAKTFLPWLCVIPSFPAGYDVSAFTAVPAHTRGAFVLGGHDPANARIRSVIAALESGGVSVRVDVMEGIGHDMPEDFMPLAEDALRAIAQGAQASPG